MTISAPLPVANSTDLREEIERLDGIAGTLVQTAVGATIAAVTLAFAVHDTGIRIAVFIAAAVGVCSAFQSTLVLREGRLTPTGIRPANYLWLFLEKEVGTSRGLEFLLWALTAGVVGSGVAAAVTALSG